MCSTVVKYQSLHLRFFHFSFLSVCRLSHTIVLIPCSLGLFLLVSCSYMQHSTKSLFFERERERERSVVIFNTVMCTMAYSLKSMQHLGYRFSGSQRAIHLPQYADDTCLIGDGPASCKKLLEGIERWLDWSGMKVKVPKCHTLALRASTAKAYDPKLNLYGQPIHFLGNQPIRFLGTTIQVPCDSHTSRKNVSIKLSTMLENMDAVLITCHQKLLLYRAAACPRLNWDFGVNQFPMSWVTSTLEAVATRFLKRWVGLAKPADPSRLYLPKMEGGLGLPAISTIYRKQQASVASLLLTSPDPIIQHTVKLAVSIESKIFADQHTSPCWR